jgi:uncharacterized membrane protein
MLVLIVALGLFFLPHAVPIFASFWRDWMLLLVGALQWKGQCALIASAGFGGAHLGYGLARQTPMIVYTPPFWLGYVPYILMLPGFPLALVAIRLLPPTYRESFASHSESALGTRAARPRVRA